MAERGRDREGDGYMRGTGSNLHSVSTASSDQLLDSHQPSTDEDIRTILNVTPVNVPVPSSDNDRVMEDDEPSVDLEDNDDESMISSDSRSDHSSEDEEEESNGGSNHSEDESEEDLDEVPIEPPQSEWDKALRSGKPSQGRASDFFVSPLLSTDSSEFYSTAQAALATAPGEMRSPRNRLPRPTNVPRSQVNGSATLPSKTTDTISRLSGPPRVQAVGEAKTLGKHLPSLPMAPSESSMATSARPHDYYPATIHHTDLDDDHLNAGVLPDMLMTMRQRIESINMFDSDILRMTNDYVSQNDDDEDSMFQESRESLKRSSQQSISAAVLVSLAHKRYERRRLAAMEIEKVVRSLVVLQHQTKAAGNSNNELDRVRAILLLLSDDYVRSTNEDARKGGVVALAACAIGLKKAPDQDPTVQECRDLILASVVHACQDHSQRVRYYATESLFNVVKVIPSLVVQHFFILFEVLRSLFADVDSDVRSGAELLDKKLKEIIVGAMNAGIFTAEQCVPVFARFVYMRNKPTKRLTLTWLQELNEKLIGAPILEFLHLFLGGVIEMVADPSVAIRQSALAFLQSMLPKLLVVNSEAFDDMEDEGMFVDFDKILQSLVTTMEHPNPFVRKVAMYWMSRIVKAHMSLETNVPSPSKQQADMNLPRSENVSGDPLKKLSTASISVRNAVPHVLPGILLSVGDNFVSTATTKDSFLPDQTTRSLAEQTNACIQDAVRRDGESYVEHLDSFIVALRDEITTPGGSSNKNAPAVERTPYRMDVLQDGTGIETAGWFRASKNPTERNEEAMVLSRLCALHWVIVLYESVVPDPLKADYAREFINALILQLADSPPETIVFKTLEVLSTITVSLDGESLASVPEYSSEQKGLEFPMDDASLAFAMEKLKRKSRDREVFSTLIQLHADNEWLLAHLSTIITYMCKLQPPEFVMVSFAVELHSFIQRKVEARQKCGTADPCDLKFVSAFIQNMNHVTFNTEEARDLRDALKDCIAFQVNTEECSRKSRLFHILLHSFSHNIAATLSMCLWAGAYRTVYLGLNMINPLDINLIFLLEIDRLIEMLERPIFRHLHVRMLERDAQETEEGSGMMLFQLLKSVLMILPQSACYRILRDRLVTVSRFRQSTIASSTTFHSDLESDTSKAEARRFVNRILEIRTMHCSATWQTIRQDSLETSSQRVREHVEDEGADRRSWLGYRSKEEQLKAEEAYQNGKNNVFRIEDVIPGYHDFGSNTNPTKDFVVPDEEGDVETAPPLQETDVNKEDEIQWKQYWATVDK